jgi:hypothetical protein
MYTFGRLSANYLRPKWRDHLRLHTTPFNFTVKVDSLITQGNPHPSSETLAYTSHQVYCRDMKYALLALGAFILLLMVNAFLGGDPLG